MLCTESGIVLPEQKSAGRDCLGVSVQKTQIDSRIGIVPHPVREMVRLGGFDRRDYLIRMKIPSPV